MGGHTKGALSHVLFKAVWAQVPTKNGRRTVALKRHRHCTEHREWAERRRAGRPDPLVVGQFRPGSRSVKPAAPHERRWCRLIFATAIVDYLTYHRRGGEHEQQRYSEREGLRCRVPLIVRRPFERR